MEATGTYNSINTEYFKSTGTTKYILSGQSYEYYISTKPTMIYVLIFIAHHMLNFPILNAQ